MLKPPVPAVEKPRVTLSKISMPPKRSKIINRIVRKIYIEYNILVLSLVEGTIFSICGPVVSALRIFMLFKFVVGRKARTKTKIPIPPIQFVKERQKSNPLLKLSTLSNIEAPVVVKPDTVSKKAFMKLGISPLMIKGSDPNKLIIIHDRLTIANPSIAYMLAFSLITVVKIDPRMKANNRGIMNAKYKCSSLYMIDTTKGSNRKAASKRKILPMALKTVL